MIILFSDGTLSPLSLPGCLPFFIQKRFASEEVFCKVTKLSKCKMALPFNYL